MNVKCLTCGVVGHWGRAGRCDAHRKAKVSAYENTPNRRAHKAVLYGSEFRTARKQIAMAMSEGMQFNCPRCGLPILGAWDCGHSPEGYRPEHPACNRANSVAQGE